MLSTRLLYALQRKIRAIEADRHALGWNMLPTAAHLIVADGHLLRCQILPRPARLSHLDPLHRQVAAYTAAAAETVEAPSMAGLPLAVTFTVELCPGCHSRLPHLLRRTRHPRRHWPTVRILVAVDAAGLCYYLQRDRDTDEVTFCTRTLVHKSGPDDLATRIYHAMLDLLAMWQQRALSIMDGERWTQG